VVAVEPRRIVIELSREQFEALERQAAGSDREATFGPSPLGCRDR